MPDFHTTHQTDIDADQYCLRIARLVSLMIFSPEQRRVQLYDSNPAPWGYDETETSSHQLTLVGPIVADVSQNFANVRFLEDKVNSEITKDGETRDVILMCSNVNFIDSSALESLEHINHQLSEAQSKLHLSRVLGPGNGSPAQDQVSGETIRQGFP